MSRPFSAARAIGLDAGDAMPNVGGVGGLAHLAVAGDVDAGSDLPGDNLIDCSGRFGFEHGGVDGVALLAAENEVDQRLRPRQASGMRGENPLRAGFHAIMP